MSMAYVLLTTKPGYEKAVGEEIMKLGECIHNLHILYGEYDLIAKLKCTNNVELTEFVSEKIRKIPGISNSRTLLVADKG